MKPGAQHARTLAHRGRRLGADLQRRWASLGALWRRSLQLRIVVSTLALSSSVVFVLGMVLQTQITTKLISEKDRAAYIQTEISVKKVERELLGVDPVSENLQSKFASALAMLTAAPGANETETANNHTEAGVFTPVLIDGRAADPVATTSSSVGPFHEVPAELRRMVESGDWASQNTTVTREAGRTPIYVIGAPVRTAGRAVQLYLVFPLTAEQRTVDVVQSTLFVGGLVLLLLLAGIANLVTRQVVHPVRQAAEIAERFADGSLEERMSAVGEDDVARLAESFNEMAGSIQNQIQQLEEFGTLQRRFTSDVSHELRTPLTTVRMAADVLHASREQFPAGLARSTELLVNELDRFEVLLADLLEISRLDAGVADLSVESVDVRSLVDRSMSAVRVIALNAGVEVQLHRPDTEVVADIDFRRVERILRNLLANAVDHSEGRPIEVRVAEDSEAVAVSVRDHGVGLRPGQEDLVFTRFWRADPSRNRQTGGTGLGLAISLEDARLHGGWLDAWGEVGLGACFRLTLPKRPGIELTGSPLPLNPTGNAPLPPQAKALPPLAQEQERQTVGAGAQRQEEEL
ncbi:MtrAB system histidine kinase MtrB [Allokutzneria sp. A3M-2-11 16]|uniref:MtrAB system histidine kinase MtrB n=1 Tax=Allokutzneria sp. A3M-2-11 16 TaxID=2962043 RepID=UPI0020B6703E|nr:MtrAB system histidine kinase MtrB [Allokutzneria sp. A3M-2-11 16]MCP3800527.1 MtrAB system histidine kinase MtrB [Allokutzneria sp. A3M-2-11 16]